MTNTISNQKYNLEGERIASSFNESCSILCDWKKGNENGFNDALESYQVPRERVYELLRAQVGDSEREDSGKPSHAHNPAVDFPEIQTATADCGGGSEYAWFAELDVEDGITVGYASCGFYYAIPADHNLPVPEIEEMEEADDEN